MYNYSPFETLITYSNKTSRSTEKSPDSSLETTRVITYPKGFEKKKKRELGNEFLLIPKQFTTAPLKSMYNPFANWPLYRKKRTTRRRNGSSTTRTRRR